MAAGESSADPGGHDVLMGVQTSAGTLLPNSLPLPSWPSLLSPQQKARLSAVTTHV